MTTDNASGAGTELPNAWDYAYEWDSPFGLRRSFDYQPYNGAKPDRHISLFTEDQLRDYAQAHNVKLEAQVERLREALEGCLSRAVGLDPFTEQQARAALKP
jgi:hypothetical protein